MLNRQQYISYNYSNENVAAVAIWHGTEAKLLTSSGVEVKVPPQLRRVDTDVNIDTIRTNLFVFTVKGLFLRLLSVFTAIRLVGLPLLGTFRIVSILLQMIVILSPLLFFLSMLPMTSKFEFRVLLGKPVVDFGAKLAVLA